MSHSEGNMDLIGRTTAFYNGKAAGIEEERERILKALAEAGYRAAWELIKGETDERPE